MQELDEILMAISARIKVAIDILDSGRAEKASKSLKRIVNVLPKPDQRNIDAAEAEENEMV